MSTILKLQFVINPISGGKSKQKVIELIEQKLPKDQFEVTVRFTERENHATELALKAVEEGMDCVIAVGGDGTINEVAQALVGTQTALGIIPYGSGNGLARHLEVFLSPEKAIENLKRFNKIAIDTCFINEKPFFCTSGVGFDAYVSSLFAQAGKRGFKTYVKSTLKAFFGYKPEKYILQTDEGKIELQAFSITFANASQYGNNAYIAPHANIQDGYIDVCILKPFPKWKMPLLGIGLFLKQLPKLRYYQSFRVKSVFLTRETGGAVHIDGENLSLGTELKVSIQPKSLYVITG